MFSPLREQQETVVVIDFLLGEGQLKTLGAPESLSGDSRPRPGRDRDSAGRRAASCRIQRHGQRPDTVI
eukprot:753088-Hanusia_phi.AAC.15